MSGFSSLLVVICLYVSILSASEPALKKMYYELDFATKLFEEFIRKYNKSYEGGEYNHRLEIFKDNLAKINEWNSIYSDAVFGIGPFTDLTSEEFTGSYTGQSSNFTTTKAVVYKPIGNAPDSLDWRDSNYVTEVKHQGDCGSCYVFSAIANIEGQYAKLTGQLISLSEQQGLDCDNQRGCDGGHAIDVMNALAKQGGSMRGSDYPYEEAQGQCRKDESKIVVKVTGGSNLQVNSEEDLKDAVANHGPLSVGMFTSQEMKELSGGVFSPSSCQNGRHAVLLVGYGTEGDKPYWLIKNSWGPNWNENGYLRLIRGQKACDIGYFASSATVAA